jgi:hypothetical protein
MKARFINYNLVDKVWSDCDLEVRVNDTWLQGGFVCNVM